MSTKSTKKSKDLIEKLKKSVREIVTENPKRDFYLNTYEDYLFMAKRVSYQVMIRNNNNPFMPHEKEEKRDNWILFILRLERGCKLANWVSELNIPVYLVEDVNMVRDVLERVD